MTTQRDWHGVRDRVDAMVDAWRQASGTGYFAPDFMPFERPLTEPEMAEVEAQYGVALPSDYRSFLIEVGNGGIGPWTTHFAPELNSSELTLLRRMPSEETGLDSASPYEPSLPGEWGWVWQEHGFHIKPDLSGPFVDNGDWQRKQLETLRAVGHEPGPPDPDSDYLDDYISAFGDSDAGHKRVHEDRDRGALMVCGFGCGMTGYLVVVGPHRGEVRWRDAATNPPLEPEVDRESRPHTFRTWYLDWLSHQETELGIAERSAGPTGSDR